MTKERHSGDIEGISAASFILEKFYLHFCYSWNFQREERDLRFCTIHFWACSDPSPHPPTPTLAAEYTSPKAVLGVEENLVG